jgi:hypothetical protein
MTFSRPMSILRSAALRPATRVASISRPQVRFATQGYGSGDGSPAGEKPQQQGSSNSESIEHPGPPPPKVAKGKSSSSPNEDSGSSSSGSSSGSSSSSPSSEQSQSNDGASKSGNGGVKGAKPKILSQSPPTEEGADVKQHNEEMKHRADKATKIEDVGTGKSS